MARKPDAADATDVTVDVKTTGGKEVEGKLAEMLNGEKKKDFELRPNPNRSWFSKLVMPTLSRHPRAGRDRWCPEEKANFLSRLTFFYMNSLMALGYCQSLDQEDLWDVASFDAAPALAQEYEGVMGSTADEQHPYGKVALGIWRYRGARFLFSGLLKVIHDVLSVGSPLVLEFLLKSVQEDEAKWQQAMFALIMFAAAMTQSFLVNTYFHINFRIGMHVKVALVHMLFNKGLRIRGSVRSEYGTGKLLNLTSNDAMKLWMMPSYLHTVWSAPFQIILIMVLLFRIMKPVPAIAGLLTTLLLIPINIVVGKKMFKIRRALIGFTDRRIRLITEVITGIKAIKLYAWEIPYTDRILKLREDELRQVIKSQLVGLINTVVFLAGPILVTMVSFIVYVEMDYKLTADVAFPAIALFNLLRFPILMLPMQINNLINASVALKRMQGFVDAEEKEDSPGDHIGEFAKDVAVGFKNASFEWSSAPPGASQHGKGAGPGASQSGRGGPPGASQNGKAASGKPSPATSRANSTARGPFKLQNVDLEVKTGQLVVIVGQVGCGKSSLLSALLGEMEPIAGTAGARGALAYTAQDPWIQNATLRDNVLMGLPEDEERYAKTLEICALLPDIEVLPAGDLTEIGEKGVNLSGGQKHRVALARAVYADADTYLFDDPLSAVDAHVGSHLFNRCIKEGLAGKTRVLVTHQLQFLEGADVVVVMERGGVAHVGSYRELVRKGVTFTKFAKDAEEESEEDKKAKDAQQALLHAKSKDHYKSVARSITTQRINTLNKGGLVGKEHRSRGSVDKMVYWSYITSWGPYLILPILTIIFALGERGAQVYQQFWLSDWSEETFEAEIIATETVDTRFYLYIFVALGVGSIVLTAFRSLCIVYGSNKSSRNLHHQLLTTVVRLPMSFFDSQPAGRLLNRFAKDTESIDSQLAQTVSSFITVLISVIGSLVIMATTSPYVLVALALLAGVYLRIQQIYIATSREVKRLDSVATSPIFGHFKESLEGLLTVRAFGKQREFAAKNFRILDNSNRSYWSQVSTNRWLSIRLEALGHFVVLAGSLSVLLLDAQNSSIVGLTISAALQLTGILSWLIRVATEMEVNMNAAERLLEYNTAETEAAQIVESNRPGDAWPDRGEVVATNLQVRYRKELGLVLKGISFRVAPSEKVGVCGRTGCGKSTLMLALFRIVEPCGGSVTLDGVDIQAIGLNDLRSKMALVPQDPVIFSGTFRSNLDPFDAAGATTRSGSARLLLLDEATSNVDNQTDAIIQQTIRSAFGHCTVLTIAHRLHTVIDYDKVLVLDDGNILEHDTPANLLAREGSAFGKLVDGTSANESAALRQMAAEGAQQRAARGE
ncbi:unnamed protein product [Pedinophyceae sp. YPF-701]|nr:unnamed protein product [Pedinophyceae sp. YPF-701]